MRWSGVILLLFIVYHLMHFTFGQRVHPHFVARATSTTTSWPASGARSVSVFYIVAMLALGLHLYHGVWSMLQTLGLSHPRYNRLRHAFAALVTARGRGSATSRSRWRCSPARAARRDAHGTAGAR